MSDEGRLVAGRYRMVKRIGAGAMGAVWQAHDEVLGRTVAVKQLLLQPGLDAHEAEEARARTMREGRIAARLHHPNAITVFDVVTDDNGQPCLIMEFLESTSLAQELQRHATLDPMEVAGIGAQVASALAASHAVGIVHRDIKPGNILLAGNGIVKLTDFGISRATDDVTVTKTGMIAGTPAYLAPEVAIGQDPGPESDIFSLGSTLYAATEGQPPFGLSENTLSLLHAVAAGQINPPRQSGPLTSVLAVMLHPETQHRPTAAECEELLVAVSRGETPLGGAAEDPTRKSPSGPGMGTAVLGGAAGGAIGGALGAAAANGETVQAGHAGTLGSVRPTEYRGGPPGGYPPGDYDATRAMGDYGDYQATRATPTAAYGAPYGGQGAGDDYDGYDPYGGAPPPDDAEPKGNWKVPAAIGSVVVLGMAAFAFWLFGGGGGTDAEDNPPARPVATTSNVPKTTTTTTTTTSAEPVETEETNTEPEYVPPPEPEPEEPTTTTTTPPPTEESSEDDEPPPPDNSESSPPPSTLPE